MRLALYVAAVIYFGVAVALWVMAEPIGATEPVAAWALMCSAVFAFGTGVYTTFQALTWGRKQ